MRTQCQPSALRPPFAILVLCSWMSLRIHDFVVSVLMSLLVCVLMASAFGQCSIDHRLLTTSDALSSFRRPVILPEMVSAAT
jgi:hypothetical protein